MKCQFQIIKKLINDSNILFSNEQKSKLRNQNFYLRIASALVLILFNICFDLNSFFTLSFVIFLPFFLLINKIELITQWYKKIYELE